jgi:hypothetical protein
MSVLAGFFFPYLFHQGPNLLDGSAHMHKGEPYLLSYSSLEMLHKHIKKYALVLGNS